MTQSTFLALCLRATVMPELALENEQIRIALAEKNDAEVERILTEEF